MIKSDTTSMNHTKSNYWQAISMPTSEDYRYLEQQGESTDEEKTDRLHNESSEYVAGDSD